MLDFTIGQTVRITGAVMTGNVGTVVHQDETRGQYLVRISDQTQNYFDASDLEPFSSSS